MARQILLVIQNYSR